VGIVRRDFRAAAVCDELHVGGVRDAEVEAEERVGGCGGSLHARATLIHPPRSRWEENAR
jgi:hypothetical protein